MKHRNRFLPFLVVSVVAAAVYAQTATYSFAYDDIPVIAQRRLFHDLANWRAILGASWWSDHTLYRPFTALTFAVNWDPSGGDPRIFHVTNVLLHAAACTLVYVLGRQLLGVGGGLVAAVIFAVHPVHVEAVANVVGRAEVLAALFALGAVLLYQWDGTLADLCDQQSWRRYAAAFGTLASMLLALASKESAFAVPGLLLLVDWFAASTTGRPFAETVRRHWVLWVGAVGIAVIWLLVRADVVNDLSGREVAPGLDDLGLKDRTLVMLPFVLQYARLLLVPAKLSTDYSPDFVMAVPSLTAGGVLGAGLLALAALAGWRSRRSAPVVPFALAWIGGTLFIISNILVPTGVLLAERTLYLASVGAALLFGWVWRIGSARAPKLATAGFAALALAGAARTVTRNPVWRSNDTILPTIVRDAPGSFRGAWVAAALVGERGDTAMGEHFLREAIRIFPLESGVWRDLAALMHVKQRYADAANYFWAAWRLDQRRWLNAQQAVYDGLQAGAIDTAEARLEEARRTGADRPELKLAAADVALARGKPRLAMTLRRQVTWQFPRNAGVWAITAEAALATGDCAELVRSTGRVRALRPDNERLPGLEAGIRRLRCDSAQIATATRDIPHFRP